MEYFGVFKGLFGQLVLVSFRSYNGYREVILKGPFYTTEANSLY